MKLPIPVSEDQVVAACDVALRLAPSEWLPDLPAPSGLLGSLGVPAWHPFEYEAWGIGESIRQAFVQSPRLKEDATLTGRVAEVATRRNLRRGRQSFVMAIGFVAARQHAATLALFLNDPDVDGQIVHTLLKMKAGGYARSVTTLLQSEKTWIRRLAKKYIDRYPS